MTLESFDSRFLLGRPSFSSDSQVANGLRQSFRLPDPITFPGKYHAARHQPQQANGHPFSESVQKRLAR